MKITKLNLLTSLLALSIFSGVEAFAGNLVDVEAAAVEYKTTHVANMMGMKSESSGTESLYLKEWGKVQMNKSENNINDVMGKRVEREMDLLDKDTVYSVDFESRVIHKTSLQALSSISPQEFASYSENWRDSLQKMGAQKRGNEAILGYPCEIWEMPQLGSKVWIHKGLALKTVTKMAGVEATSIAVDVQIGTPDAAKFELPDFQIVQGDAGFMPGQGSGGMPGGMAEDDAPPTPAELQQAAEAMKKLMQGMGNGSGQ